MARAIGQRDEAYNHVVLFDNGIEIAVDKVRAGQHPTWRKLAALAEAGSFYADPTPCVNLAVTGGDAQVATVGAVLPLPLEVRVTTAYGLPIAGAVVTFTDHAGKADVSTTDANGKAHSVPGAVTDGANPVTVQAVVPLHVPVGTPDVLIAEIGRAPC